VLPHLPKTLNADADDDKQRMDRSVQLILSVKTWSPSLRKEYKLSIFESKMMCRIFGWRKEKFRRMEKITEWILIKFGIGSSEMKVTWPIEYTYSVTRILWSPSWAVLNFSRTLHSEINFVYYIKQLHISSTKWDLRFSRRRVWRWMSSGMLHRVVS
jgi:hypothetical protein